MKKKSDITQVQPQWVSVRVWVSVRTWGKLPSSTTVSNSWSISWVRKSSTSYCCRSSDHTHTNLHTMSIFLIHLNTVWNLMEHEPKNYAMNDGNLLLLLSVPYINWIFTQAEILYVDVWCISLNSLDAPCPVVICWAVSDYLPLSWKYCWTTSTIQSAFWCPYTPPKPLSTAIWLKKGQTEEPSDNSH